MHRFSLDGMVGRAFPALPPPAPEGFFIASADRSRGGSVAGQGGACHGVDPLFRQKRLDGLRCQPKEPSMKAGACERLWYCSAMMMRATLAIADIYVPVKRPTTL